MTDMVDTEAKDPETEIRFAFLAQPPFQTRFRFGARGLRWIDVAVNLRIVIGENNISQVFRANAPRRKPRRL